MSAAVYELCQWVSFMLTASTTITITSYNGYWVLDQYTYSQYEVPAIVQTEHEIDGLRQAKVDVGLSGALMFMKLWFNLVAWHRLMGEKKTQKT